MIAHHDPLKVDDYTRELYRMRARRTARHEAAHAVVGGSVSRRVHPGRGYISHRIGWSSIELHPISMGGGGICTYEGVVRVRDRTTTSLAGVVGECLDDHVDEGGTLDDWDIDDWHDRVVDLLQDQASTWDGDGPVVA
ncbi:MAG: hypothetical protein H6733_07820 [Alphaproteobacteria bacterium]|nr:hypothetical protein [Alphaproteobacteria bacterium]